MNKRWAWALVVYLFATVVFPVRTEWLNRRFAGIFTPPDGSSAYDAATLARTFGGAAGAERWRRVGYGWTEVTLDVLFPVAYATLFALVLLATFPGDPDPKRKGRRKVWRGLAVGVPVGMALADLVENGVLFAITRRGEFDRCPECIAENAEAIAGQATWAAAATKAKFGLFLAVLALLVWALCRSRRLGRMLTLLWIGRVPILALASLVVFAGLGAADRASPTVPNMLALDSGIQVLAIGFLASLAAMLAGFSLLLVWELGPLRAGVALPAVPGGLANTSDPLQNSIFVFFALPFIVRTVARSGEHAWEWVRFAGAALTGVAGAVLVLQGVRALRRWVMARYAGRETPLLDRLAEILGPGYAVPGARGFLAGHGLAAAFAAVLAGIYFLAWWALSPGNRIALTDAVPTAGYLLGLIAVLVSLLSGAAFFFDRWRVPLLAVMVVWVALVNQVHPMVHEFAAAWRPEPLPTARQALEARFPEASGRRILTVVTASGGGIQAAAWTARVLTGLAETLDPGFTRSIGLMSSVSGGSVGCYFVLSAFGREGGLPQPMLEAVRAASRESALEETAWGILFPDLQRGLQPFGFSTRDRGWAIERGWRRAAESWGLDPERRHDGFSEWVEETRRGAFPAVIFNTTRIDDGMPLRLSTVGPSPIAERPGSGSALRGLSLDFTYQKQAPEPGHLGLESVTAARLSATFPYVSPIARPASGQGKWWAPEDEEPLRLWHVADGGYFDNHGTVSALAWLHELRKELGTDLGGRFDRVVWLQIDAFPEADPGEVDRGSDWMMSALGPVRGIVKVRTASQRVRRAAETELEELVHAGLVRVFTLAPPERGPFPQREAPLSWELSAADQARMDEDWEQVRAGEEVRGLVDVFGGRR